MGGLAGAAGAAGSGGIAGAAALCDPNPAATGSLEGKAIEQGNAGMFGFNGLTNTWWGTHSLGEFLFLHELEIWAWGNQPSLPQPTGIGHALRVDGTHYCIGDVEASHPMTIKATGTINYADFSKLGSCANATGPVSTLNVCRRSSSYQGTPTADCPENELHVWGSVGADAMDFSDSISGGGTKSGSDWIDYRAFGPALVLRLQNTNGGPLDHGFLRAMVGPNDVTLCVTAVTDSSEPELARFALSVVKLGSCPATPVSGNVTGCL